MINRMMLDMRSLSSVIIAFGIVCILSACSNESDKKIEVLNEYEIKNSAMYANEGSINWLDNERVIFVHYENKKGRISIWNTSTGEILPYAPEGLGGICFADGYIQYGVKRIDRTTYLKLGVMGKEKLIVFNWDDDEQRKYRKNQYSCKRYIRLFEHKNRLINYLREDHGYIDMGINRKDEYEYPVYVKNDGSRITLPLKKMYYQFPEEFYKFKNGYFIWKVTAPTYEWKNEGCNDALWLYPDGKTEKICIPLIENLKYGSILVYPVLSGYIFVSHDVKENNDPGKSGIYYLDNNLDYKQKILSGLSNGFSISPNGCNVAFLHQETVRHKSVLKTINVCNNGGIKL
ncbi:MAG: hypothetical protein QM504_09800 [Pseudomonadota bacterium]